MSTAWLAYLGPFLFFKSAACYKSFSPSCSNVPENTNYVSGPQIRGTIQIILTCLAVVVICTYTIQHLAVPTNSPRPHARWWKRLFYDLRYDIRKLQWMTITLIAPEFILGKAMAERSAAHHSRKQINQKEWTKTHACFANMNGFVLRFDIAAVKTSLEPIKAGPLGRSLQRPTASGDPTYEEQDYQNSIRIEKQQCKAICKDHPPRLKKIQTDSAKQAALSKSSTAVSDTVEPASNIRTLTDDTFRSSFELKEKSATPDQPEVRKSASEDDELCEHKIWQGTWPLNANQILYAYQHGIIKHLPNVTQAEINDRSKADALVKGLAIFQILWIVVQIIARAFQHLAITLLEITVLAFALCALVIYYVLWHKPQDVKVPIYIDAAGILTREQVIGLAARSPLSSIVVHEFFLHGVAIRVMTDSIFPSSPGIRMTLPFRSKPFVINPGLAGLGLGGGMFGAVHFAAWNFQFPTPVERLLWRISCIIVTVFPHLAAFGYTFVQHIGKKKGSLDTKTNQRMKPVWYSLPPIYLLARLFLVVEVFRSLAYLPPSAFEQVDWESFIPHIS